MWQQTLIAIVLLGLCVALIAIKSIFGRGQFRIGHACRMKSNKKPSSERNITKQ